MIKAVIFDLDGTLTKTASPWRHVHERLGVWESTACAYLDEWLAGRITYDEFCRRDADLWRGRSIGEIHSYLDEISLNRHVPSVAHHLMTRGIPSVIISSGFRYVASKIQQQLDWMPLVIHANELFEGPEVRINVSGDFASPISKKALAERTLATFGAAMSETLVVSDTTRDLEQLCDCGYQLLIAEEDDLQRVTEFR
jgi:phosphoserine phosphatase